MATVCFTNAKLLIDGAELSVSLNELGIEHGAEMLDETTFGYDTRINKGCLKTAAITGGGFARFGPGLFEETVFSRVGVNDTVFVVFPDGINEGGGPKGYAMLGVIETFTMGGSVGVLLPLSFDVQSRGLGRP